MNIINYEVVRARRRKGLLLILRYYSSSCLKGINPLKPIGKYVYHIL
jgi:hypothetical protein